MASPVGIGVVSGRVFLEVNDRFCQMTGYSPSELVGKSVRVLYPSQEDFNMVGEQVYNQVQRCGTGSVETRWRKKDGGIIDILLNLTPLDPAHMSGGITFTALDITERKQAEQALRESENRYRTLAETSRDLIFLIGRDDRVEYVNSFAAAILGLSADEIIGKKRSSFFTGEPGKHQAQELHRVFETGTAGNSERAMEIFGTLHWFDHYLMPITDAQGTVTSVLGVSRDITDRKLADEQRLQREQQYRFISDNSLDIINRQTPDCICTYVSPAITPRLGYSEEEVLGKSVLAMVHPDDLGRVRQDIMAIMQNGSYHVTSTFRFRHKDGRYLRFESTTKVIRDEKTGQIREFLSISRDITARKPVND